MASAQPLEPSHRLAQAAAAEVSRLQNDLEKTQRLAAQLRRQLDATEQRATTIRQQLTLLDQLGAPGARDLGRAGRSRLAAAPLTEPANGWLRGVAIRQAAVRLLAATARPEQPIHYTRWLSLLQDAGYGIQGRDPGATFLTQIGRSPVIVRADQPGTYTLDFDVPARLRERLTALSEELLTLHHGQQTIEEIASVRDRRSELVSEIDRVERNLEEAIAAIGFDERR